MHLVIFSICHNEEESIEELSKRIPTHIKGISKIEYFVLDDGSTDSTFEIAQKNNVEVYRNISQKRLAYSFQKALDISLKKGADIVVNIDGDLQYSPEEIPKLVEPILNEKANFVAATRFVDDEGRKRPVPKNMPKVNYYGNLIGTKILSKLAGNKFSDVTSGFRAYDREAMLSININGKYTYTQETFQQLSAKQLSIIQVPVSIIYFPGRKSRVVKSAFSFIGTSALNIIRSFRDFTPMLFFFWFGMINFALGVIFSTFTIIHYLQTRSFSPYKAVGIVALFFISLGIVVWIFGLLADMLDRVIKNQEKTLYLIKEKKYDKKLVNTSIYTNK